MCFFYYSCPPDFILNPLPGLSDCYIGITWIPLWEGFALGFVNEGEVKLFLLQSRLVSTVFPIVAVSFHDYNLLMEYFFHYCQPLENSVPFVAFLKFAHTSVNNLFIEILSTEPSEWTKS